MCGDLGAGKTHFVKGLAVGLNSEAAVTSPTFTLIHEYVGGRLPLYHFDFYRLEDEDEALKIGLDEYLQGDGVCVIEWADKFPGLLPAETQWCQFTHRADGAPSSNKQRARHHDHTGALDTSTAHGSVALLVGETMLLEEKFTADRSHMPPLFSPRWKRFAR